ncbi:MAG: hypothetical protein WC838_06815 [Candidatus Margulisiibacteriota bacterium]|jgi:hypothetical protein
MNKKLILPKVPTFQREPIRTLNCTPHNVLEQYQKELKTINAKGMTAEAWEQQVTMLTKEAVAHCAPYFLDDLAQKVPETILFKQDIVAPLLQRFRQEFIAVLYVELLLRLNDMKKISPEEQKMIITNMSTNTVSRYSKNGLLEHYKNILSKIDSSGLPEQIKTDAKLSLTVLFLNEYEDDKLQDLYNSIPEELKVNTDIDQLFVRRMQQLIKAKEQFISEMVDAIGDDHLEAELLEQAFTEDALKEAGEKLLTCSTSSKVREDILNELGKTMPRLVAEMRRRIP